MIWPLVITNYQSRTPFHCYELKYSLCHVWEVSSLLADCLWISTIAIIGLLSISRYHSEKDYWTGVSFVRKLQLFESCSAHTWSRPKLSDECWGVHTYHLGLAQNEWNFLKGYWIHSRAKLQSACMSVAFLPDQGFIQMFIWLPIVGEMLR